MAYRVSTGKRLGEQTRRWTRWIPRRPRRDTTSRFGPFDDWAKRSTLVEAFVDTFRSPHPLSVWDEGLASMISGLLGATGCSILATSVEGDPANPLASTGTWGTTPVADVLTTSGLEWTVALREKPMTVHRRGDRLRLRPVRRVPGIRTDAVVLPLRWSEAPVGALLLVYSSPWNPPGKYWIAAKLLAGFLEVELANERLLERVRHQGEWLSRLTSDVERMESLLRARGEASSTEAG